MSTAGAWHACVHMDYQNTTSNAGTELFKMCDTFFNAAALAILSTEEKIKNYRNWLLRSYSLHMNDLLLVFMSLCRDYNIYVY